MPAYLIGDIDVRDRDRYQAYLREVPRIIQKHGGEYLVRGGAHEVIEGVWQPHRLVLLRFPDMKAIRETFNDPEYQPWKALRHECTDGSMVAVEGIA
jgi:uncharacterized protein (DUF1330 family)